MFELYYATLAGPPARRPGRRALRVQLGRAAGGMMSWSVRFSRFSRSCSWRARAQPVAVVAFRQRIAAQRVGRDAQQRHGGIAPRQQRHRGCRSLQQLAPRRAGGPVTPPSLFVISR